MDKKESREEELGPSVVLALTECIEDTYRTNFFFTLSSAVHPLLSNFSTKAFAELVLLEWIRKEYGKKNRQIKRGYHEYQFTETVT